MSPKAAVSSECCRGRRRYGEARGEGRWSRTEEKEYRASYDARSLTRIPAVSARLKPSIHLSRVMSPSILVMRASSFSAASVRSVFVASWPLIAFCERFGMGFSLLLGE